MDNFQVFCIAVITATFSLILHDFFKKKSCCDFKRCQCIPEFYSEHIQDGTCDMKKLSLIAKTLYKNDMNKPVKHNVDGCIEVIIPYDFLKKEIKLTKNELSIIEGIIMANGHTYYEI